MKNHLLCSALALLAFPGYSFPQVPYNSAVPNGYTKKAAVSEQVGLTQVTVTYHRPAVKGLGWATLAASPKFPGDPTSFPALTTKAAILAKPANPTRRRRSSKAHCLSAAWSNFSN